MSNNITGKWCYSINEENYYGQYDTEGEAHGDAHLALEGDDPIDGGMYQYWIAQCCSPLNHVRADRLGSQIEDYVEMVMADECAADDYILTMTKGDKEKLGQLVIDFIRENGSINYYSVENVTEHTYVVPEEM